MFSSFFSYRLRARIFIPLTFICLFSFAHAVKPDRLRVERNSKTHGVLWNEKRIERNFNRHLPLIESLGYLAYYHSDLSNENWNSLLTQFQSIGEKRELLKQGLEIRGERLPDGIERELKELRKLMLSAVNETYGETTKNQLIEYLTSRSRMRN